MKRSFIIIVLVFICIIVNFTSVVAADTDQKEIKGWTPLRITLWPEIMAIPWDTNVYGINFGIATDLNYECELVGVDLSVLGSTTNNAKGLLMSIAQTTYNSNAVQLCLGGVMQRSSGVQLGVIASLARDNDTTIQPLAIFNRCRNSSFCFQFGLYNRSMNSKGFQIGLINYMDDGILPVLPFFNFSINENYDKTLKGDVLAKKL